MNASISGGLAGCFPRQTVNIAARNAQVREIAVGQGLKLRPGAVETLPAGVTGLYKSNMVILD
jgi:hypothetical protein